MEKFQGFNGFVEYKNSETEKNFNAKRRIDEIKQRNIEAFSLLH